MASTKSEIYHRSSQALCHEDSMAKIACRDYVPTFQSCMAAATQQEEHWSQSLPRQVSGCTAGEAAGQTITPEEMGIAVYTEEMTPLLLQSCPSPMSLTMRSLSRDHFIKGSTGFEPEKGIKNIVLLLCLSV